MISQEYLGPQSLLQQLALLLSPLEKNPKEKMTQIQKTIKVPMR